VAFTAFLLIANHNGLRKNDSVALELAQRWSKAADVLIAVGGVTGTVLTFEFGLLSGMAVGVILVIIGFNLMVDARSDRVGILRSVDDAGR
jgi:cytochrome bd ubiquinol oxidase subunit I